MNIVQMNGAQANDNESGQNNKKKPEKPLRFVTNYGAPHPKRRRIGAACLTCRKRKTACSGERPFCDTCKQNKLDCAGYSNEAAASSGKRTESDNTSRASNEPKRPAAKATERNAEDNHADSANANSQHVSSTSNSSNILESFRQGASVHLTIPSHQQRPTTCRNNHYFLAHATECLISGG
ncbi:hypothetical protein E2P81_ATG10169 [Venturia nashicola]|nr:hypothetical protein E2P81_ATG10169 [Venturia nashicola]